MLSDRKWELVPATFEGLHHPLFWGVTLTSEPEPPSMSLEQIELSHGSIMPLLAIQSHHMIPDVPSVARPGLTAK